MTKKSVLTFFKVLCRDDFTRILRLPREFIRKYGSNFPKKVILRISGRTWDVKVGKMEDGHLFFSRGWDVFSKDITLKFGEFLVFEMDDDDSCTFDVSCFEISGCIKEFHDDDDGEQSHEDVEDDDGEPSHEDVEEDDDDDSLDDDSLDDDDYSHDDDDVDDDVDDDDDEEYADDDDVGKRLLKETRSCLNPLYYEVELKPHDRHILTLRRGFTRAAKLKGKEEVKVVGKQHTRFVRLINTHKDKNRIDLGHNWYDFQKLNRIVQGKTYSIEFNPNTKAIHINNLT